MANTAKTILWLVIIIIIIIAAIWYGVSRKPAPTAEEPIKIGVIVPLTGEAASYGDAWQKGVELGVEKVKNEFPDEKIEIVYEDSQFLPSNVVTAVQKLINIDRVKAIIIGTSRETLAAAPIAESNKVLLMASGSSPEITKAGDYIFRIYPSDTYQGNDLANLAVEQGYKRMAILQMLDDYGKGISDVFKVKFSKKGGSIAVTETFLPEGATDFKTQLNKIANSNPDAILIVAAKFHYPLILKQAKELNIDIPVFAGETVYAPEVLESAGELAEGILFTSYTEPKTGSYDEFVSLHQQKYGAEPGLYSAGFFDNAQLVLEALIKNDGNIEKAKEWLYAVEDWKGATGITNFDENGDVIDKSYSVYEIKNGQFVPYED